MRFHHATRNLAFLISRTVHLVFAGTMGWLLASEMTKQQKCRTETTVPSPSWLWSLLCSRWDHTRQRQAEQYTSSLPVHWTQAGLTLWQWHHCSHFRYTALATHTHCLRLGWDGACLLALWEPVEVYSLPSQTQWNLLILFVLDALK